MAMVRGPGQCWLTACTSARSARSASLGAMRMPRRVMAPRQPWVAGSSTCSWVRKLWRASRRIACAPSGAGTVWDWDFWANGFGCGALAVALDGPAGAGVALWRASAAWAGSFDGFSGSDVVSAVAGGSGGCGGGFFTHCGFFDDGPFRVGHVRDGTIDTAAARSGLVATGRWGGGVWFHGAIGVDFDRPGALAIVHHCAHGGTALCGVFADQFDGLCSRGNFAGCGELVDASLDVHGGGAVFVDGRFNEFFGGAHDVLAFFTLG